MAIYQDLVERFGFTHRYNSVKRFVRGLKKKDPKQYDRLEFLPGEEAQVDFALGGPGSSVETETLYTDADGRVVWKTTVEPGSPTDDALELAVTVTHPDSGETRRVPKTLEFR